jgi:hypothetical protein
MSTTGFLGEGASMINPFLRRPGFQHRLPAVIRRLILIVASTLIAYYVLSTFLKGLAQ